MNESLWFHAMKIGHSLGALKTPAHGMGGSVIREGFGTMQHCERESTVTNTDTKTHTHTHTQNERINSWRFLKEQKNKNKKKDKTL